jgi:hypothetical protein
MMMFGSTLHLPQTRVANFTHQEIEAGLIELVEARTEKLAQQRAEAEWEDYLFDFESDFRLIGPSSVKVNLSLWCDSVPVLAE